MAKKKKKVARGFIDIEKAVDDFTQIVSLVTQTMDDLRKQMQCIKRDTSKYTQECTQQVDDIWKVLKSYSEVFEESNRIAESSNEVLGAVLLAIRQNEYLQAYYPEQHGFKAGKYTGQHPSKLIGKGGKKHAN